MSGLDVQCAEYPARHSTEDWNMHPFRGRDAAFYLEFWQCPLQCLRLSSAK